MPSPSRGQTRVEIEMLRLWAGSLATPMGLFFIIALLASAGCSTTLPQTGPIQSAPSPWATAPRSLGTYIYQVRIADEDPYAAAVDLEQGTASIRDIAIAKPYPRDLMVQTAILRASEGTSSTPSCETRLERWSVTTSIGVGCNPFMMLSGTAEVETCSSVFVADFAPCPPGVDFVLEQVYHTEEGKEIKAAVFFHLEE